MKTTFVLALAYVLTAAAGCAVQRAETARKAQIDMIGLPKEKVLACIQELRWKKSWRRRRHRTRLSGGQSFLDPGDPVSRTECPANGFQRHCLLRSNGRLSWRRPGRRSLQQSLDVVGALVLLSLWGNKMSRLRDAGTGALRSVQRGKQKTRPAGAGRGGAYESIPRLRQRLSPIRTVREFAIVECR